MESRLKMDETLLERFVRTPTRENAGASSSNRFDYQKNWALVKLLELHKQENNYKMVFEHHEDIVVFEYRGRSELIDFYQIKSKKNGNWTVNALTKNKNTEKDSILGKLFECYENFSENTGNLVFISNQSTSAKVANEEKATTKEKYSFSSLEVTEKEKIQIATHDKKCDFSDLEGLSKFKFIKSDLQLEGHSIIAKGKLLEFFEDTHPEKHLQSGLAYKTLFDEIRRKTNYEKKCESVEDLLSKKTISKDYFERILKVITFHKNPDEVWGEACQLLNAESYSPLKIREIKNHWQDYLIEKMDTSNEPIQRLIFTINDEIRKLEKTNIDISFKKLEEIVSAAVIGDAQTIGYDGVKLTAAILHEVVENDPIPEVSQKFKEETA